MVSHNDPIGGRRPGYKATKHVQLMKDYNTKSKHAIHVVRSHEEKKSHTINSSVFFVPKRAMFFLFLTDILQNIIAPPQSLEIEPH